MKTAFASLFQKLFPNTARNRPDDSPADGASFSSSSSSHTSQSQQLEAALASTRILKGVVFDLMVEIEALRATALNSPLGAKGSSGISPYAFEYRNAAFRTHHCGGCTPPTFKHLHKFFSHSFVMNTPLCLGMERDEWRELIFMERLGFTPEELAEYKRRAEEAHTYS
ncbi:hypothetical protein [Prosthecobacter sp.]|uniref:hypothetical protein n=1 Tax=Prosthecobacter sp. TaxID=1965333 RepID=UPI003784FC4E